MQMPHQALITQTYHKRNQFESGQEVLVTVITSGCCLKRPFQAKTLTKMFYFILILGKKQSKTKQNKTHHVRHMRNFCSGAASVAARNATLT